MKIGTKFNIDTDRVSQYKGERIVDTVNILVVPTKAQKKVLVYSPKLRADILVYKSDLKVINKDLINKLKGIKSVKVLSNTNQFISIKFALKDKRDIIVLLNGLSISTHTQDGLTTGTIQIF